MTEREVRHGILTAKDQHAHCVAYLRVITNMSLAVFCNARNFIDMIGHDTDSVSILPSNIQETEHTN